MYLDSAGVRLAPVSIIQEMMQRLLCGLMRVQVLHNKGRYATSDTDDFFYELKSHIPSVKQFYLAESGTVVRVCTVLAGTDYASFRQIFYASGAIKIAGRGTWDMVIAFHYVVVLIMPVSYTRLENKT